MTESALYGGQEVIGVDRIEGPIVFVEGTTNVGYDEVVEILDSTGRLRRGRVLEVGEGFAVVQVFAGSTGLSIDGTRVRFLGGTLHIPVAEEMLGRVFDGLGSPLDGGPEPLADRYADVNGQPINPTARVYPSEYIQTGISAIDGMNTLLRGQKLPIFSGAGMPHDQIAAQIVRQATLGTSAGERPSDRSNSPSCLLPWASSTTWRTSFGNRLRKAAPSRVWPCSSIWPTIRRWNDWSLHGRRSRWQSIWPTSARCTCW